MVKEEKPAHIPDCDDLAVITRSMRDVPPSHYTFKIEGFSMVSEMLQSRKLQKYESRDFEAGGYKWKLSLYPEGDKDRNGDGYISLFLQLSDKNLFPFGSEVNVVFKLFVYNYNRDKYLMIQDGKLWRLHALIREIGISQLLQLEEFNDPSNGYLVKDCCAFGAEVFVIKCQGKGERLSLVRYPENDTFTWDIKRFFGSNLESLTSDSFSLGGYKWDVLIHPTGVLKVKGEFVSIFLNADEDVLPLGVYADYSICIKNQVDDNHKKVKYGNMFDLSAPGWGNTKFMALSDLQDPAKGFIVDDTVIVEVKISLVSTVHDM